MKKAWRATDKLSFLGIWVAFLTHSLAQAIPKLPLSIFLELPSNEQLMHLRELPLRESLALLNEYNTYVREMGTAALVDPLTGLRNRRALDRIKRDSLENTLKRQISVIAFDLDHFKRVNDHYGHAVGDQVLAAVAREALAKTRDPVFRTGGEEFEVLLVDTSLEDALKVANRLRDAFKSIVITAHPAIRISASFGVSTGQVSTTEELATLESYADTAAYASKSGGRDRISINLGDCEGALSTTAEAQLHNKP